MANAAQIMFPTLCTIFLWLQPSIKTIQMKAAKHLFPILQFVFHQFTKWLVEAFPCFDLESQSHLAQVHPMGPRLSAAL